MLWLLSCCWTTRPVWGPQRSGSHMKLPQMRKGRSRPKRSTSASALLPHAVALTDHPLMALGGSEALRGVAGELLDAYSRALKGILDAAKSLKEVSPEAAKRLRARAVAIDVVFVRVQDEISAVLTPT